MSDFLLQRLLLYPSKRIADGVNFITLQKSSETVYALLYSFLNLSGQRHVFGQRLFWQVVKHVCRCN